MTPAAHATSRSRTSRTVRFGVVTAFLGVVAAVGLQTSAGANNAGSTAPPPTTPTSADQIQNIDQVRTAIKGYYGDQVTSGVDPVTGTAALHTFDPNGSYAHEVAGIEADAGTYLDRTAKKTDRASGQTPRKAIVLDIDDTTLNTYSYEIYSNFVYNPTTNAAFVNSASFPAVPGMTDLVHRAQSDGYTVFYLTGRPESQRPGTVTNLVDVGYDVNNANLYLKDLSKPIYASCYNPPTATCSTTQYKSLTRQYIESQGYDIVANFGDQYSDLNGGFADQTYKIPNPMYYLP